MNEKNVQFDHRIETDEWFYVDFTHDTAAQMTTCFSLFKKMELISNDVRAANVVLYQWENWKCLRNYTFLHKIIVYQSRSN